MLENKLLIWKFNRGNKEVLARIYDKYKDYLVTLATALLNNKSDAEDSVHDVFVSFINSAGTFRLTGSLRGFLATCVANNARSKNRTKLRHSAVDIEAIAPPASDYNGPDQLAIVDEQSQLLRLALAQLPFEQREVIILHIKGRMKFRQIAKHQQVSINTIQGRYRYGLNKLRALMNGEVTK